MADVWTVSKDKGSLFTDRLDKEHIPGQESGNGYDQEESVPIARRSLCMHSAREQGRWRLHRIQGSGSAVAYAWFVFRRGHAEVSRRHWI